MSLFICGLAFEASPTTIQRALRLCVLGGSLIAGTLGTVILLSERG